MSKLSLTEATILALQGKLPMKENKVTRRTKQLKKEDIDINVDDKTSVSVMDNSTVVDTDSATIVVDKKEDNLDAQPNVDVPVDSDDTIIPEDLPQAEDIVDDDTILPTDDTTNVEPVTTDTTDIDLPLDSSDIEESKQVKSENKKLQEEISNDAYIIAEAIAKEFEGKETISWNEFNNSLEKYMKELGLSDNYFNEDLADFDNDVRGILSQNYGYATIFEGEDEGSLTTKTESVEIEVSDDGKEVEVTTDNGEEVEVKDETPDETDTDVEPATDVDTDVDTNIDDEPLDENKKLQEEIEAAPFRNLMLDCLNDDIETAQTMCERMLSAWSDDDCKWYCETYELVEPYKDYSDEKHYYKDIYGNIRDISGQIADDENNDLEEAKHRKVESVKKIEARIRKNRKVETTNKFSNTTKQANRNIITKCDLKSFNEALSKALLKDKKIETIDLVKAVQVNDKLKMEAKLNMVDKTTKNICVEMKSNKTNNNFTRYNLIKENKDNNLNLTMLTFKNKDNILECRYINKI